jgi:hypothetical protein
MRTVEGQIWFTYAIYEPLVRSFSDRTVCVERDRAGQNPCLPHWELFDRAPPTGTKAYHDGRSFEIPQNGVYAWAVAIGQYCPSLHSAPQPDPWPQKDQARSHRAVGHRHPAVRQSLSPQSEMAGESDGWNLFLKAPHDMQRRIALRQGSSSECQSQRAVQKPCVTSSDQSGCLAGASTDLRPNHNVLSCICW